MSRTNFWVSIAFAFLVGVSLTLFLFKKLPAHYGTATETQQKLNEILNYVDEYYVDPYQKDSILYGAINGMLEMLDPHSVYASAEENKKMMESLDGAFEGVGIQFNIMNDTLMVIATIHGGPSEKAGIQAGDRIITVNGEKIAGVGISNEKVTQLLRGKKNTTVQIGVKRPGFDKLYTYKVTRDVIPTYTVDVSYMIDNQIGYIKINQFGENTYKEFLTALRRLRKQGLQSLILDLRGNSGGYLNTAINICDEFLKNKEMIVYTEGRKIPINKIYATEKGSFETGELVILIDDWSASASEIVAGAIQDNDRGWIVGRRSFGKGLVQQQFSLSDNSSLQLTVARYHTPSGRCIQKKYNGNIEDYYVELLQRFENGEMDNADSIKFDKNLRYKTKKGRIVYGGGGIMPDFFVPLDRDSNVLAFNELYNSGLIIEFAFDYVTQNKKLLLQQYPDAPSYIRNMTISDDVVRQFLYFYKQKGNKVNLNKASKNELKLWLKALIGRNLFDDAAFYPVINQSDKTILKALDVIKK